MLRRRNTAIIERLGQVRRGVYAGNYKLTTVGERVEALYNIDRDPTEACDLSAEYPALVAKLQGKIKAFVDKAERHSREGGMSGDLSREMEEHLRALGYID